MNNRQRRMVWGWILVGLILLAMLVFDDFVAANADWLRWLALAGVVICIASGESLDRGAREAGRERFAQIVEDAPWLKVWYCVYALVCFGVAIYLIRSSIQIMDVFGFRVLLLAFIFLMGPLAFESERRRFQDCGDDESAA